MGMYTELIFCADLIENLPDEIVMALDNILNGKDNPINIEHDFFKLESYKNCFFCSSYYFPHYKVIRQLIYDDISNNYNLHIRCNIKNYKNEIELFLDWIKKYIDKGSGQNDMYALTIYEEDIEPKIYYMKEE